MRMDGSERIGQPIFWNKAERREENIMDVQ